MGAMMKLYKRKPLVWVKVKEPWIGANVSRAESGYISMTSYMPECAPDQYPWYIVVKNRHYVLFSRFVTSEREAQEAGKAYLDELLSDLFEVVEPEDLPATVKIEIKAEPETWDILSLDEVLAGIRADGGPLRLDNFTMIYSSDWESYDGTNRGEP